MDSRVSFENLPDGSIRSKQEYFAASTQQGLPKRCPILQRCARRTFTIKVNRYNDGEHYVTPKQPLEPVVEMIEEACLAGGRNNFFVNHMCPEVALFDPSNSFPHLSGYPMTSAEYDKYWDVPYKLLDTGHFSECLEFLSVEKSLAVSSVSEGPVALPVSRHAADFSGAHAGRDLIVNVSQNSNTLNETRRWVRWLGYASAIATILALPITLAVWMYGDSILKGRSLFSGLLN